MNNIDKFKKGAPVRIEDEDGNVYMSISKLAKLLGADRKTLANMLRYTGEYERGGKRFYVAGQKDNVRNGRVESASQVNDKDYAAYLEYKKHTDELKKDVSFDLYDIDFGNKEHGSRYAVALFSDAHIEETVEEASVLGKNKYNVEIAKQRMQKYFANLASCLVEDEVDNLIFASLGDTISGFIHEELAQNNGLTPTEASHVAQNMIVSGLKFLRENTNLENITFVGVVGNHSRTTKKIQHANGYKMSYEWWMYHNVKTMCEMMDLNIKFILPESELAIVDVPCDGRRLIFCHGYQVRSGGTGTVCGIYPALQRLSLKWANTFQQDRIYMGHFHSCISIPNVAVNGCIIGYNSFALSNGFEYQVPCQYYEVIDSNIGQLLERKIYCE